MREKDFIITIIEEHGLNKNSVFICFRSKPTNAKQAAAAFHSNKLRLSPST